MRRSDLLEDDERRRQDAVDLDNELGIMGEQGDPAQGREVAMRRIGMAQEPVTGGTSDVMVGPQETDSDPAISVDDGPMPGRVSPALAALVSRKMASKPADAPAPEAPADTGLQAPKGFGVNFTPDSSDRVSQALYSAFSRKPLDSSFFTKPGDQRMREKELQQRSEHTDFLKDQLRLKYAGKGVGTLDPADNDAGSTSSQAYRAYMEGSKAHAGMVAKLKEAGVWENMPKSKLVPMFGEAKQLAPVVSKEYGAEKSQENIGIRGDESRKTEGVKQGGRASLQEDAQAHDAWKTEYKTEAQKQIAEENREAAQLRFDQALEIGKDKMAWQVAQKIPAGAKQLYDAGARIDALVSKLGGPDKLDGVGLLVGGVPNAVESKDVIALRHEINQLATDWAHDYFGANFTKEEQARADKVVPMVKAWRSTAEVLDGIRMIRRMGESKYEQVVGAAAPYVKERLARHYRSGMPNLFGSDPEFTPRDEPAPDMVTTDQVSEPSPEQIDSMKLDTAPPTQIRVAPKTHPAAAPPAPGGKVKMISPDDGRPYLIDPAEVQEALRNKWRKG